MAICKQCDKELAGKKQYCNSSCRSKYSRSVVKVLRESEQVLQNPSVAVALERTVAKARATAVSPPLTATQVRAGLKANRAPTPGDYDYSGAAV